MDHQHGLMIMIAVDFSLKINAVADRDPLPSCGFRQPATRFENLMRMLC
jgi:hypothetical protein